MHIALSLLIKRKQVAEVLRASEIRHTTPTAGFSDTEGETNISNETFSQDF